MTDRVNAGEREKLLREMLAALEAVKASPLIQPAVMDMVCAAIEKAERAALTEQSQVEENHVGLTAESEREVRSSTAARKHWLTPEDICKALRHLGACDTKWDWLSQEAAIMIEQLQQDEAMAAADAIRLHSEKMDYFTAALDLVHSETIKNVCGWYSEIEAFRKLLGKAAPTKAVEERSSEGPPQQEHRGSPIESREGRAETGLIDTTPIIDRETAQTLLDLLNPLHGELDRQTYDLKVKENFDAPPDAEYNVDITARMERDLTQAVCIIESRLKAATPPQSARDAGLEEAALLKAMEEECWSLKCESYPTGAGRDEGGGMTKRKHLRGAGSACNESESPVEGFIGSPPGLCGSLRETQRAAVASGDPIIYLPLSAFGTFSGKVVFVRPDGRVDIALPMGFGSPLELTRITVVADASRARPGTCYVEKNGDADA